MMLDVETARQRLLAECPVTKACSAPLQSAAGCYVSSDITAKVTQPPFHSSAMDGYAVLGADLHPIGASLKIIGSSSAGHPFQGRLGRGEAVRIFTGAALPEGADRIVLQEDCETDQNADQSTGGATTVKVLRYDSEANYIRPSGYDFQENDLLISAGSRLNYRHLTLLAAMNIEMVPVRARPRVAILATGDELVLPGAELFEGAIVSSIPSGMKALIELAGGQADILGIARDDMDDLSQQIKRAADYDILVTIGGASVGDHDLVQEALSRAGMVLNFWRIAMRPGKPLMVGRLKQQQVIGVPGNPVSALVCTLLFVVPLLRQMMGAKQVDLPIRSARLLNNVSTNGARQHYMRAKTSISRFGQVEIRAFDDQDSSLQSIFASANALLIRPVRAAYAEAGSVVDYISLDDV